MPKPMDAAAFGMALARAAAAQSSDIVFYDATYRSIAYPGGDIPHMLGACSDVVIRAYRALGIDLQQIVFEAGIGDRDRNIDHRRTRNLMKLFATAGAKLKEAQSAEEFLPGDIVAYHRPFSRVSKYHIAIVSDRLSAEGTPLLIHNRGWGVQFEDALFADKIIGHYRLNRSHLLSLPSYRNTGVTRLAAAAHAIP